MKQREHGPLVGMEQRCVEPGHWLIEGWTVKHVKHARPAGWWWHAVRDAGESFSRRKLEEVREEIRSRT